MTRTRTEAASASEAPDRDRGASFVPGVVGQGAGPPYSFPRGPLWS